MQAPQPTGGPGPPSLETFTERCKQIIGLVRNVKMDTGKVVEKVESFLVMCRDTPLAESHQFQLTKSFLLPCVSALMNRKLEGKHLIPAVSKAIHLVADLAIKYLDSDSIQLLEALSVSLNKNRQFYTKYGNDRPLHNRDWPKHTTPTRDDEFGASIEEGKWLDVYAEHLGTWQNAHVLSVEGGNVTIQFQDEKTICVHKTSQLLAKFGTKTHAVASRNNASFPSSLKKGDRVRVRDDKPNPPEWKEGRITQITPRPGMEDLLTIELEGGKSTFKLGRNSDKMMHILSLTTLPSGTPAQIPSTSPILAPFPPDNEHYRVTADEVTVLSTPQVNGFHRGKLTKGTKIRAISRKGRWIQVNIRTEIGLEDGWCSVKALDGSTQIQIVPFSELEDLKKVSVQQLSNSKTPVGTSESASKLKQIDSLPEMALDNKVKSNGDWPWGLYYNFRYFVGKHGLEAIIDRIERTTASIERKRGRRGEEENHQDFKKTSGQESKDTKKISKDSKINPRQKAVSARVLQKLVGLFAMEGRILSSAYARRIVPRFHTALLTCVSIMTPDQVRGLTKVGVSEMELDLVKILKTIYSEALATCYGFEFGLASGLKRLESQNIERRLNGLEHISEALSSLSTHDFWPQLEICRWIESHRVVQQCFGPTTGHPELMRGCLPILKLLMGDKSHFSQEITLLLWEMTVRVGLGENSGREQIMEIWKEFSWKFGDRQVSGLMTLFEKLTRDQLTPWLMKLMVFLLQTCDPSPPTCKRAIVLLWTIAQDNSGAPERQQQEACASLKALADRDRTIHGLEDHILEMCIKSLKAHDSASMALQMMRRVIQKYEEVSPAGQAEDQSQSRVIEWLDNSHKLIPLLLDDISHFRESFLLEHQPPPDEGKAKEVKVRQGKVKVSLKLGGYLRLGPEKRAWFVSNITTRLNFIWFILSRSRLTLSMEVIESLWWQLHDQAYFALEREKFFLWIDRAVREGQGNYPMFNSEMCKAIFINLFLKKLDHAHLGSKGYFCFEHYFLYTNKKEQRIKERSRDHWEVVRLPLHGMDMLWRIVTNVPDTSLKVLSASIRLLNNIHNNLCPALLPKLGEIRSNYIKTCMHNFESHRRDGNEAKLLRCVTLLNRLLDTSESRGVALQRFSEARSHGGLLAGRPVQMTVWNTDKRYAPSCVRMKIENVHNHTTLWEVRKAIAERMRLEPVELEMKHHGKVFASNCNSRLLKQLPIRNPVVFHVCKSKKAETSQYNLLGPDYKMIPELVNALSRIFENFARHRIKREVEGEEEDGQRKRVIHEENVMNPTDLRDYLQKTGFDKRQAENETWSILRDHGGHKQDFLTLHGFFAYYDTLCRRNTFEHVWEDLTIHGFRHDLLTHHDAEEIREKYTENVCLLPRTLIVNDKAVFRILLSSLETNPSTAEDTWNLLQRLPTHPPIFQNLKNLTLPPQSEATDATKTPVTTCRWDKLIPVRFSYEMMYHLQVVQFLMSPRDTLALSRRVVCVDVKGKGLGGDTKIAKSPDKSDGLQQSVAWRRSFFSRGGYEYLYRMLALVSRTPSPVIFKSRKGDQKTGRRAFTMTDPGYLSMECLLMYIFLSLTLEAIIQAREISQETLVTLDDGLRFFLGAPIGRSRSSSVGYASAELPDSKGKGWRVWKGYVFAKVARMMKEPAIDSQMADTLLQRVNWANLQEIVLGALLTAGLSVERNILRFERLVENGMFLWCACMLADPPRFFPSVYKYMTDSTTSPNPVITNFLNNRHSQKVRALTAGAILTVCHLACTTKYIATALDAVQVENPHSFFVRWLFDSILQGKEEKGDRHQKPMFDEQCHLLAALIQISPGTLKIDQCASGQASLSAMVVRVMRFLRSHKSTESSKQGQRVDRLLSGMLDVLTELVKNPMLKEMKATCKPFIKELFEEFLFSDPKTDKMVKCCTKRSRRSCFKLLGELMRGCSENFRVVLDLTLEQHKGMKRLSGWENDIGQLTISDQKFVGLKNMGATCYMNSVLQQLYMTSRLRYGILLTRLGARESTVDSDGRSDAKAVDSVVSVGPDRKEECKVNLNSSPKEEKKEKDKAPGDGLLRQLQVMFGFLTQSERNVFDMNNFCKVYQDPDGKVINHHHQCDAQEFLSNFLSLLEKQLEPTPQKHLVKASLMGTLCDHHIRLSDNRIIQEKKQDFLTISLQVQGLTTLQESLRSFVSGEVLQGAKPRRKAMCLGRLPNTLILHLNRFTINMKTFQHEKLHHRFEFPVDIDLYPYTQQGLGRMNTKLNDSDKKDSGEEKKAAKRSVSMVDKLERSRYHYHLVGVVVHKGTAETGHYYSIIQARTTRDGKPLEPKWVKFDDNHTLPFDVSKISEECYGEGEPTSDKDAFGIYWNDFEHPKRATAYMLVYERDYPLSDKQLSEQVKAMQKESKEAEEGNEEEKTKSQRNRAEEEGKEDKGVDGGAEGKQKEKEEELYHGVTTSAFSTPVKDLIPPEVLDQVIVDNRQLVSDREIFCQSYYRFFADFFLQLRPRMTGIGRKVYDRTLLSVFRFMHNVIARSRHHASYPVVAEHLKKLLIDDPQGCEILLDTMANDPKEVASFAVICRSLPIQRGFLELVLGALVVHSRHHIKEIRDHMLKSMYGRIKKDDIKNTPACVRVVHLFVSIVRQVRDNWVRMREFFNVLLSLVIEVPFFIPILITSPFSKNKLLPDLLALSTHEYPIIASRANQPKLTCLLPLLAMLLRCCSTPKDDYKLHQNHNSANHIPNPKAQKDSTTTAGTPAATAGSDSKSEPEDEDIRVEDMTPIPYRMAGLRQDLVSVELIKCCEYDSKAVSEIVCHWIKDNRDFSVVDRLMDAIEKSPIPLLKPIFDITHSVLSLKDTYQSYRIHMFLGNPGPESDQGMVLILQKASMAQQSTAANNGKNKVRELANHLIWLGSHSKVVGMAMAQNSSFCTGLMQCLRYTIEDEGLLSRFVKLAESYGASLSTLDKEVFVWNCRACTYENPPGKSQCDICQQYRFEDRQLVEALHTHRQAWRKAMIVSTAMAYYNKFQIQWQDPSDGAEETLPTRCIREIRQNSTQNEGSVPSNPPESKLEEQSAQINSVKGSTGSMGSVASEVEHRDPNALALVPLKNASAGPSAESGKAGTDSPRIMTGSRSQNSKIRAPTPVRASPMRINPAAESNDWKPSKRSKRPIEIKSIDAKEHQGTRKVRVFAPLKWVEGEDVDFFLPELGRWVDAIIITVNNEGKVLFRFADELKQKPTWRTHGHEHVQPRGSQNRLISVPVTKAKVVDTMSSEMVSYPRPAVAVPGSKQSLPPLFGPGSIVSRLFIFLSLSLSSPLYTFSLYFSPLLASTSILPSLKYLSHPF
ncbi:hypothetical protein AAMO2058_001298800 [Amorphochlora amoebiformis]